MPSPRGSMKRWVLLAVACLAFVPLLSACATAPVVRHFTFDHVQDETGTGKYTVGRTATGTATEKAADPMAGEYTVSIQFMSDGGGPVTAHPTATIYFTNSTVHCFADGAGPHDPVLLTTSSASTQLICEEPFPDPMRVRGITVTDAGR